MSHKILFDKYGMFSKYLSPTWVSTLDLSHFTCSIHTFVVSTSSEWRDRFSHLAQRDIQ